MANGDVVLWQTDSRGIRVKRTVAAANNEAIAFDGSGIPETTAIGGGIAGYEDVASASTTNLFAATAATVRITGTTTITAFDTAAAGTTKFVVFADALTLTHNATSFILPSAANITTAAGDSMTVLSLGSGNAKITAYNKANGNAVVSTYIISTGAIF